MNIKFVAETFAGPAFVIRFYARDDVSSVDHEPDLIRALKGVGAPVADVISDSRTGPPAPLPYMIYEFMPGVSLADVYTSISRKEQRSFALQVARFLAVLTELDVQGYGDLVTAQSGRYHSCHDFLAESFDTGLYAARLHGTLSAGLQKDLATIRAALERFDLPTRSRLAWGDVLLENIVVRGSELAGIVDFEGTLAAEPALNIGYCRAAHDGLPFASDLKDAWSSPTNPLDEDRSRLYAVLRGVRLARFAHLPLPTGEPRVPPERFLPGFRHAAQVLARRLG